MNKICTTPEQSQKLIELGINVNTADMQWVNTGYCMRALPTDDYETQSSSSKIPAWSLAALLSVLPKNLEMGRPVLAINYKGDYWVQYYDEYMQKLDLETKCYDNSVDAVFEMIVWLKENKKI